MALFKTTAEIKTHCPALNRNMAWDTIAPAVEQAERKYILTLLGKEQYNALNLAYNEDTMSDQQEDLLIHVQRPLAYYTYYHLIPLITTQVSDMGNVEITSSEGTATPARQWVYEENRLAAIENGDTFAEQLLEFLEENHTDYPLWKESSAFTITKELLINSSKDFQELININDSRRVWLALRNFVKMAEDEFIRPAMTDDLFEDLKTKFKESLDTDLSDEYKALIAKAKPALAWLAVQKALSFAAIQFTPSGIVMGATMSHRHLKSVADSIPLQTAMTHATNNGMGLLRQLKQFLIDNCTDYPLYEDEDGIDQPNTELPDNRGRNSFMV